MTESEALKAISSSKKEYEAAQKELRESAETAMSAAYDAAKKTLTTRWIAAVVLCIVGIVIFIYGGYVLCAVGGFMIYRNVNVLAPELDQVKNRYDQAYRALHF